MTRKQIAAALALFLFLDLYAFAFATDGVAGLIEWFGAVDVWSVLLMADLTIAIVLVCIWVWHDARTSGRNALGWVLLTLATGSIGPLIYLSRRR